VAGGEDREQTPGEADQWWWFHGRHDC
jgi:hypothetical protein